jgi:glycosyltransferase involved in cell wall biosynthesis
MNILFLSDVPLRNPSSGSEKVLNNQVLGILATGEDVTAITRKNGKGPIAIDNKRGVKEGSYYADPGDVVHFFASIYRHPLEIYKRLTTSNSFDIAICHQPFTCFILILRKQLWKLPIIYVFHSPSHKEYLLNNNSVPQWKKLIQTYLRKWIEGFCIKRAQKVITLSCYMADMAKTIHGIPGKRIFINPGGVDLISFHPKQDRKRLKDKLDLPPGRIHLLTIRNLDYRMGLDNLLKAIKILNSKQPEFHLTIGGEGQERKNLEIMVRTLGLSQVVTLTGFIPLDKLVSYYAAADFFILPTRKLEGFGLVTPESMACGTPVLGTPVGGTIEILSGFNPEFLFKDTSPEAMVDGIQHAVNEYYYDKRKYKSLRQRCRKYVEERYSWDRHVKQLRDIIVDVVSKDS